jgi:predicted MFS family arabinose efflux permease
VATHSPKQVAAPTDSPSLSRNRGKSRVPPSGDRIVHKPWRFAQLFITPEFGLFSLGSFPSAMGGWMQQVALGWLVVGLGGSALWLGLLTLATMGPLLCAPLGGTIVDRLDRRLLLLTVTCIQAIAAGLLAALALTGWISLPAMLLLAFVGGAPNAIGWPAWSAFIADLVPPHTLRQAVAVNSARFNLTRVVGPALAGLLLAEFSPAACLIFAAVATSLFAATLTIVRPKHTRLSAPPPPWLEALRDAFQYARSDRPTRALLLSAGALGLLVLPYTSFLPRFAKDVLGQGPQALGLLLAAGGVGAVAGAATSGMRLYSAHPARSSLVLHIATAISAAALALSPILLVAMAAAVLVGYSSTAYLSLANGTLQVTAPPGMLGRLMGIWVVVNAGSVPVGAVILGAIASNGGLRNVQVAAAVVSLLGAWALLGSAQRARPAQAANLAG